MGAADSFHSVGGDGEKAFRASAAFRRRVASVGGDVPFSFQAIESGVDGANRDFAIGAAFDLLPHADSVGAIFEPQERQDDDVLEFAEIIAVRHYLYNIEQILHVVPSTRTTLSGNPLGEKYVAESSYHMGPACFLNSRSG